MVHVVIVYNSASTLPSLMVVAPENQMSAQGGALLQPCSRSRMSHCEWLILSAEGNGTTSLAFRAQADQKIVPQFSKSILHIQSAPI